MANLSRGQLDVSSAFFGLSESEGFVLVGGAALIVLDLVDRLTEDLDFFVSQPGRVVLASRALIEVAANRGWAVSVLRQSDTFWRLEIVCDGEVVRVDLALDSPARLPIAPSSVGPTLAPIELAGRKLLALFDRAQPRDFVDVFELVRRFGKKAVLSAALDIDPGLDSGYLAVSGSSRQGVRSDGVSLRGDLCRGNSSFC
jgi:predicted nucleotidyltransferase component of viral defense system